MKVSDSTYAVTQHCIGGIISINKNIFKTHTHTHIHTHAHTHTKQQLG